MSRRTRNGNIDSSERYTKRTAPAVSTTRPVAKLTQVSDWPEIRERILALKAEGRTAQEIAERLNREGRISSHLKPFTATTIRAALSRLALTQVRRSAGNDKLALAENEWFVPDLARELNVSRQVVYSWLRAGRLHARQVDGSQGRWIVRADATLLESLKTASGNRANSRAGTTTADQTPNAQRQTAHV